ncbi:extracellular exo-alpha-L-arabinofuranosidase precursor [mine drainage metagenome]|uniref:non-reducing end alpha-L-arabinofuranosidase n=1 Tax=mine drainage metagenome TaxID=410659 RepID=A0A1J5SHQ1_9ZZZZ
MKLIPPAVALLAASACFGAGQPSLTIDASKPLGQVSPRLYGLMTEEINYSYDGGLYAELVRNRAFLDDEKEIPSWAITETNGAVATMSLDRSQPLNAAIPVSLRVDVTSASPDARAGIANSGYWGIPVHPNTTYRASFFAKAAPGYTGDVTVTIQSDDGRTTYASATIKGLTGDWKQYSAVLKTGAVKPTERARYLVTLDQPGTAWFSFVSLFPPTWNNRPNGFRKDLMQMLVDLKPKFLRFPGGNYLEGGSIAERFDWKKTIGPVYDRPGHMSPWGYRSTDGMGLLEFLEWCQDMKAEPVLAVYAGYSLNGEVVKAGPGLEPYVQDALDEIEYVTGDASTKWGAQRIKDGHPAPFPLHYVEIGNEDGFDKSDSYDGRFTQIYKAIKAKYPELKCISTAPQGANQVHSVRPDVIDDHYYSSVPEFLKMGVSQYDHYDRSGPEVFVGEWASHETVFPPWSKLSQVEAPTPDLRAAIGDAAFMTDFERNSDIVKMNCYAPLFVNVNPGGRQWRPDLIGYDALRSYGSPSYYAFKMFSTHLGDQILKVTGSDTSLITCATRDSGTGEIFLKLVNASSAAQNVVIDVPGAEHLGPTAKAIVLSAPATSATNTICAPTDVVPQTTEVEGVHSGFSYTVPGNGVVVLILDTK